MKKLLYVDGCVLRESSRTEKLAQTYLKKQLASGEFRLESVVLENEKMEPLDGAVLQKRDKWIAAGDFSDGYFDHAKSFAAASEVVFAVPYWDLNFPSMLKIFLERLTICGLTFRYSAQGKAQGLTAIEKVTYITTAGGLIGERNFGYDYVKALMQGLFSIPEVRFICAEGLDVEGCDPQAILDAAIRLI